MIQLYDLNNLASQDVIPQVMIAVDQAQFNSIMDWR